MEILEEMAKGIPTKMSYDEIMRTEHFEEKVNYQGKIIQLIKKSEDNCIIIVGLDNYKTLWIELNRVEKNRILTFYNKGGTRMLEGDMINVWGDTKGIQTYKGILGNNIKALKIISNWTELIKKSEDIDAETKEINYLKSLSELLQKIYVSAREDDVDKIDSLDPISYDTWQKVSNKTDITIVRTQDVYLGMYKARLIDYTENHIAIVKISVGNYKRYIALDSGIYRLDKYGIEVCGNSRDHVKIKIGQLQ